MISRYFHNPTKTEILDKKNEFYNLFQNKSLADKEQLSEALRLCGVMLDQELEVLYFK